MGIGKKGLTLFEAVMASIVLSIMAAGLFGAYTTQSRLFNFTVHRMQAMNFAKATAESLLVLSDKVDTMQYLPQALSIGAHTELSDPLVCEIDDDNFKNTLGGRINYTVKNVTIKNVTAYQFDITVCWHEKDQEKIKNETLSFVTMFGYSG